MRTVLTCTGSGSAALEWSTTANFYVGYSWGDELDCRIDPSGAVA
jgi:hypothetical protein